MERVILPITGPYTAKDQAKSDKATCFIGRGSPASSTAKYAKAWGDRANKGSYTEDDVVFVSVEGNRRNRIPLNHEEMKRAANANARFITDTPYHRYRLYNVGEREAAALLQDIGYTEVTPGFWKKGL